MWREVVRIEPPSRAQVVVRAAVKTLFWGRQFLWEPGHVNIKTSKTFKFLVSSLRLGKVILILS